MKNNKNKEITFLGKSSYKYIYIERESTNIIIRNFI